MNKKNLLSTLSILIVIAVFLAACGSAAPASPTSAPVMESTSEPVVTLPDVDPATVAQDFYKALNAQDIEAAMALVAEDIKCRGACYLTGKASFQSFMQGSINMGGHVELTDLKVDGDKVSYIWTAYNTDNVPVALGSETLQIQNGLIVLMETQSGVVPAAAPAKDLSEPLALVTEYYAAIEASDIDQAMTFVSDTYVMTDPTGFTTGKDAATAAWKGYFDAGFTFDQSDFKATGNRVTSCYKVYEKGTLIDEGCDAVTLVQDGKIIFDGLQSAENIWIVQEYYKALNAGEIDKAMTFTADDIVTTDATNIFSGKQKVTETLQLYAGAGFTYELSDLSEKNGRVTSCYKVMQKDTPIDQGCGGVTIIRDGKILYDGLGSLEAKYVIQKYYDAFNARQLDLAMSFIASDAVFINPTGSYEGSEAIRASLEGLAADNITFKISKLRGLEGRIIYDYEVLQGGILLDQGTNGLTVVKDGLVIFDGTEETFVAQ